MDKLFQNTRLHPGVVFDNRYIETKAFYLAVFHTIPSINFIDPIDSEKAFNAFTTAYADLIVSTHTYRWYEQRRKKYAFDRTLIILKNDCVLEFNAHYCEIMHQGKTDEFVATVTAMILKFKERKKRQPFEVNLIVKDGNSLELSPMEIKRSKLDLDRFYEDDFKEVDELIRTSLNKKNSKGIVLLHGLPGTGKTTYLRYLIGKLKKRVLFLSPAIAGNLMDPGFIQLLIDNPNTVVVIEDAEHILMDRRTSHSSSVSNLLNISDGLLADFLNVQLICTFNSALTMVDSALMRKGRLIAKYEFGKLSVEKAQALSNHLGFDQEIRQAMTVAEIAGQREMTFETKQTAVIGFRRELLVN